MSNVLDIIPRLYLSIQKLNLFLFCQFSIPFTFDGAHSLYRSLELGPKLAD